MDSLTDDGNTKCQIYDGRKSCRLSCQGLFEQDSGASSFYDMNLHGRCHPERRSVQEVTVDVMN